MKYIIEKKWRMSDATIYLEDKQSKTIPKFNASLEYAVQLTENEAYEWLGRLWSMFPEDNSIQMVKINSKTGKLNYTEKY